MNEVFDFQSPSDENSVPSGTSSPFLITFVGSITITLFLGLAGDFSNLRGILFQNRPPPFYFSGLRRSSLASFLVGVSRENTSFFFLCFLSLRFFLFF
jgi:hypothetical protein